MSKILSANMGRSAQCSHKPHDSFSSCTLLVALLVARQWNQGTHTWKYSIQEGGRNRTLKSCWPQIVLVSHIRVKLICLFELSSRLTRSQRGQGPEGTWALSSRSLCEPCERSSNLARWRGSPHSSPVPQGVSWGSPHRWQMSSQPDWAWVITRFTGPIGHSSPVITLPPVGVAIFTFFNLRSVSFFTSVKKVRQWCLDGQSSHQTPEWLISVPILAFLTSKITRVFKWVTNAETRI